MTVAGRGSHGADRTGPDRRRGRRGRGAPATEARLRALCRREGRRLARKPGVHAGRQLLPVPGAARRPRPHHGPGATEHSRAARGVQQALRAERAPRPAVRDVHQEHPPGRPRVLAPLPPRRLRDPGRTDVAHPAAGGHVDGAGRRHRRLDGHPQRVEQGRGLRQVLDRFVADAVLDAGVVARPGADLRPRGGDRAAARPLPDRLPALARTWTRRRSRACWTRSGTSRFRC